MKILMLSTSDIDGGAARAAYRLHQGFQAIGADSQMLVRAKLSNDRHVVAQNDWLTKLSPTLVRFPMRKYANAGRVQFSPQWVPDTIAPAVAKINPDVVNMHWVCNGFLQIETLAKLKRPLIWTLQDMWPFTGGCHYNQGCDRYQHSCGDCPQLQSHREKDLSRNVWQRKAKAWKDINLTIVTPSEWMADCVRASSLFRDRRIEVIPFCLNTDKYRPHPKSLAREVLNLPQDKRLILYGALAATSDKRKGFDLLIPALRRLSDAGLAAETEVAVFGSDEPENPVDIGFKAHYLGHLNDDISLSLAYSAADVMIVPSLQESFGQTASEGLACGTPVVAFDATGLRDIVDHQQNGYLAKPYEVEDLAQGIAWVLEDGDRHTQLCHAAREKAVTAFPLDRQARRYITLIQDLV